MGIVKSPPQLGESDIVLSRRVEYLLKGERERRTPYWILHQRTLIDAQAVKRNGWLMKQIASTTNHLTR